jgi:glutathione S-transferase
VADCATFPALFYLRAVHRWDTGAHNIMRYYRDLLARPSIARVVEEARPLRELFPLPWPADQDDV